MTKPWQPRRQSFVRSVLPTFVGAVVLVALGLVAQDHLGAALRQSWWVALLAFVIGAACAVLPRQYPLVAGFVALLVFAWFSSQTSLAAITLICAVLGGLSFGISVRSLITLVRATGPSGRGRRLTRHE